MQVNSLDWVGQSVVNERYTVTSELGRGGMGVVFKAIDQKLDKAVVLKVPLPSIAKDAAFAERFQREIRSIISLQHPHIVSIQDVGEHDRLPVAVMAYLSGGDLADRRTRLKRLPTWLKQIAAALDFIHAKGYIHRDVKPSNVILDKSGNAYLSDFGVAKFVQDSSEREEKLTGTGIVMGTLEYMSPELLMGEPFDGRSDQYALAAIVYETICGELPFSGSTPAAIIVNQTTKQALPPHERNHKIPVTLSRIVMRGLTKEPQHRFENCSAFAKAVIYAFTNGDAAPDHRRIPASSMVEFQPQETSPSQSSLIVTTQIKPPPVQSSNRAYQAYVSSKRRRTVAKAFAKLVVLGLAFMVLTYAVLSFEHGTPLYWREFIQILTTRIRDL